MAVRKTSSPGGQKTIQRHWLKGLPLYVFTAALTLMVIQAFVRENNLHLLPEWLWKLKILDTNNAFLVLIGLLGMLIARQQVYLAILPRIFYSGLPTTQSTLDIPIENNVKIWRCSIKNVGAGMAIIESCAYRIAFRDEPIGDYTNSFADVILLLTKRGFAPGRDFNLVSYSQGSVIGSGTENIALEIKPAVTQELLVLDIRIEFSGIFGNRYLKEIFCIPRDGIEKHMFIAPKIINSITQAHI